MKDCCELALFNDEQKRLLEEMQESLEAKEDQHTQTQKMMALAVSFIMQNIKGLDKFTSVMVHFAAVMGINDEETKLLLGDNAYSSSQDSSTASGFCFLNMCCPRTQGPR